MALLAVVASASLTTVAVSGGPSLGAEPEPDPTTAPEPPTETTVPEPEPPTETTVPEPEPPTETTVPEPEPPTTTEPPTDTTVPEPEPTTTTEPEASIPPEPGKGDPLPTTTTTADDPAAEPGPLEAGETLECHPAFASLSRRQRALVEELQRATDTYALGRFALVDLARRLGPAKDTVKVAKFAEYEAVTSEVDYVAAAPSDDNWPHDFRKLVRRLTGERKRAGSVRADAQDAVAALRARVAEQTKAVADASDARTAAERAIEDELGSGAVRARPDGITATLQLAQADQPDPFVLGGIGQAIPGAALTSPFGIRTDPLCGGAGFHAGLDVAAGAGAPIHAAAGGVVVVAGECGGYGWCVVLDHGASLATLYGHQSTVLVEVGQVVDAGQVIGLVGSTGRSTGPHLHFEVRHRGLPIDPLLALITL